MSMPPSPAHELAYQCPFRAWSGEAMLAISRYSWSRRYFRRATASRGWLHRAGGILVAHQ